MKSKKIRKLLFSGKYDKCSVAEFGQLIKEIEENIETIENSNEFIDIFDEMFENIMSSEMLKKEQEVNISGHEASEQ